MERATILRLFPTLILLVLYPKPLAQTSWLQHHHRQLPPAANVGPLCAPQFALLSSACSSLTYPWVPPDPSTTPSPSPPELNSRLQWAPYLQNETLSSPEDCCRWLREVDDVCVCDLLVNLPPFLAKPVHNYTIVLDDSCTVTYQCGF